MAAEGGGTDAFAAGRRVNLRLETCQESSLGWHALNGEKGVQS